MVLYTLGLTAMILFTVWRLHLLDATLADLDARFPNGVVAGSDDQREVNDVLLPALLGYLMWQNRCIWGIAISTWIGNAVTLSPNRK